jgi:anti-sigma factor RsiW
MSCDKVKPELVAYHFGTIGPEAREAVEEHLPDCGSCLREFIALKRNMETSEEEPRPSQAARERLRLAVARELRARAPAPAPARSWRWWERPLAFGGALAVLTGAIFMTYSASVREGVAPRTLSQMERGAASPALPE